MDARAVRHQPGQRAGPQAVARGAVGTGVGEEPARHSDGEADGQGARRGQDPGETGQEHQRPAVPEVVADLGG